MASVFIRFVLHIPTDLKSTNVRILETFCIISFLQPLQKSEHATFNTLFNKILHNNIVSLMKLVF